MSSSINGLTGFLSPRGFPLEPLTILLIPRKKSWDGFVLNTVHEMKPTASAPQDSHSDPPSTQQDLSHIVSTGHKALGRSLRTQSNWRKKQRPNASELVGAQHPSRTTALFWQLCDAVKVFSARVQKPKCLENVGRETRSLAQPKKLSEVL